MKFICLISVFVFMFVAAGCQTLSSIGRDDAVVVHVAGDGAISFYVKTRSAASVRGGSAKLSDLPADRIIYERRNVPLADLAGELKSMKATGNTMITVKTEKDVSDRTLMAIRRNLIQKGLVKVIIAKKIKPTVEIKKK